MWQDEGRMIKLSPFINEGLQTSFNFKICCHCETDKEVMAEIDSDSHILLVSEPYFKRLQSLGHLEMILKTQSCLKALPHGWRQNICQSS
jgi:hypothetical protein